MLSYLRGIFVLFVLAYAVSLMTGYAPNFSAQSQPQCPGSYPYTKMEKQYMESFGLQKVGKRGPHRDLPWIFRFEYQDEDMKQFQNRGWIRGDSVDDYTAHVFQLHHSTTYYFVLIEDENGCYFDIAPVNKIYWIQYIGF